MRHFFSVLGVTFISGIFGTVLWFMINNFVQINNQGLLERQGWPFDQWYTGTIAGACLFAVLCVIGVMQKIRHAREVKALAEELGLEYREELPGTEVEELPGLASFKTRSWAGNCMTGTAAGQTMTVVDLTTIEGSGESSKSVHRTLVLLPGAVRGVPDFELVPLNPGTGFLTALGAYEIADMLRLQGVTFDPERAPAGIDPEVVRQFNANYLLSRGLEVQMAELKQGMVDQEADDAVRRAFPAAVLAHFGANPGWHVRAKDGDLVLWRQTHRFCKAAERPQLMAGALEIRRVLTESTGSPVGEAVVGGGPRQNPRQAVKRFGFTIMGSFIGFFLGGIVGMAGAVGIFFLAVAPPGANGPQLGWGTVLAPIVFFGSAFGGLFLGGYAGWRLRQPNEEKQETVDAANPSD